MRIVLSARAGEDEVLVTVDGAQLTIASDCGKVAYTEPEGSRLFDWMWFHAPDGWAPDPDTGAMFADMTRSEIKYNLGEALRGPVGDLPYGEIAYHTMMLEIL